MKRVPLGLIGGGVLGLLDGLSAFLIPEARGMMTEIIVWGTGKGLVTGLLVGVIACRVDGVGKNVLAGGAVGAILSLLAAFSTGSYVEIVPSGTVLGLLAGLIVSKWGK
jgi:hypothetical protein